MASETRKAEIARQWCESDKGKGMIEKWAKVCASDFQKKNNKKKEKKRKKSASGGA